MAKKLTTEEFIEKARLVHGDKYDYSKVEYKDANTKVCIICPIHGEFWQRAVNHLSGRGCPDCGNERVSKKRRMSLAEFISKAKTIHGDFYDYSKVKYVNSRTKVCVICPIHGEFWITPNSHLRGGGCERCGYERNGNTFRRTTEEFIKKACEIHGDKYDYSLVDYKGGNIKVCIICPVHGEFWQTPASHLNGNGCPKCHFDKLKDSQSDSYDSFVEKARLVHGEFYDYTKSIYNGTFEPILIICPIHGEFWQRPCTHLSGHGCQKCAREKSEQLRRMSIEDFIKKSIDVHGDRYSYELIDSYVNCDTPVPILCKIHGVFYQTPYLHTHGCGCRSCNESKGEREIAKWLDSHGIDYMREYWVIPQQVLFGRNKFRVDFFLSEHNVIIEYHGEQHYKKVEIWQSDEDFQIQQDRDHRLREYCKQNKIRLIEIPYTEIDNIDNILNKNLRCVLR